MIVGGEKSLYAEKYWFNSLQKSSMSCNFLFNSHRHEINSMSFYCHRIKIESIERFFSRVTFIGKCQFSSQNSNHHIAIEKFYLHVLIEKAHIEKCSPFFLPKCTKMEKYLFKTHRE